jgi:hypothetical protein
LSDLPRGLSGASPCSFSTTGETNRLLELELMHRWTTKSWTSFRAIPECQPYLVDYLPRAALCHGFLMNAIFAAAAMDLSLSNAADLGNSAKYLRASLEYGTRASIEFRTQVTNVTSDNIDLLYYFASMASMVHFATPDKNLAILDRVDTLFDMLLSSTRIAASNIAWLLASPAPLSTVVDRYGVDVELYKGMPAETLDAIGLLKSVGRLVRLAPNPNNPDGQGPLASEVPSYLNAAAQTHYCFAEDFHDRIRGYFISVFPAAGGEFAVAFREREPMAMFIILYWGVLVHRAAQDTYIWGIETAGRDIVADASALLLGSHILDVAGVREGIAWTREQVGLPPIPECPLPQETLGFMVEELA